MAPRMKAIWTDDDLRELLLPFLRSIYQDLDGASRLEEVERVARIARRIHDPGDAAGRRAFELVLLFHPLGGWLEKLGNLSRTVLATGGTVTEAELRRTAAVIRRLDDPLTEAQRAVAAALRIDAAGVQGLADRFARARREGQSQTDVIRDVLADSWVPEWFPEAGRAWLELRHDRRRQVCRTLLDELRLEDYR